MKRYLHFSIGILSTLPLVGYLYLIGKLLFDSDYVAMLQVGGQEFYMRSLQRLLLLEAVVVVLMVGYLINVFTNRKVHRKALWVILVFFGNVITIPIYWYLYIWRRSPQSSTEDALAKSN